MIKDETAYVYQTLLNLFFFIFQYKYISENRTSAVVTNRCSFISTRLSPFNPADNIDILTLSVLIKHGFG